MTHAGLMQGCSGCIAPAMMHDWAVRLDAQQVLRERSGSGFTSMHVLIATCTLRPLWSLSI